MRVVVIRPGALGDTLLALPVLAGLRQAWPGALLTFVARAEVLSLALASGLADAAADYDLPVWARLWGDEPAGDADLRAALTGADTVIADMVIAWVTDTDGAVARQLAALGVRRVVAPGRPRASGITTAGSAPTLARDAATSALAGDATNAATAPDATAGWPAREHVTAYLARTLAPLGFARTAGNSPGPMPPLAMSPAARTAAAAVWETHGLGMPTRGVVAVHPGSGGAAKCWPAGRYAVVAGRLAAGGWRPVLVEGPADGPAVTDVLGQIGSAATSQGGMVRTPPVIRDVSVEVLAALLARCAAYVGNDSGVTHLAALTGCPTLALFGPTDPAVWGPMGQRVRILRAGETNPAAAAADDPTTSVDGPHAMDRLPVESVWAVLHALLITP